MDLRVQGERPKTVQELKELHQRKLKAAAFSFVDERFPTKPAALRAVEFCCFKYRSTLDYQVELLQNLHVSNRIEPASEPITPVKKKKVSRNPLNIIFNINFIKFVLFFKKNVF